MKRAKILGLLLTTLAARAFPLSAQAEEFVAFYTTLPPFGGGEAALFYLSGNRLVASFGTAEFWLISIHFPATANYPAADLGVLGPISDAYPPYEGFPGGVSITYRADLLLTDNQRHLL